MWLEIFNLFVNSSVQFSRSVMSDSLRPHGLQHTRPPCPPPPSRVCSDSCPSSRWRHPTISSSVVPLSSCLQSFPTSESFLMSQLFIPGGQSIGAQLQHQSFQWIFRVDSFRIDWFDLLAVQGTHKSLLQYHNSKTSVLCSAFFMVHLSYLHDYWKKPYLSFTSKKNKEETNNAKVSSLWPEILIQSV